MPQYHIPCEEYMADIAEFSKYIDSPSIKVCNRVNIPQLDCL